MTLRRTQLNSKLNKDTVNPKHELRRPDVDDDDDDDDDYDDDAGTIDSEELDLIRKQLGELEHKLDRSRKTRDI